MSAQGTPDLAEAVLCYCRGLTLDAVRRALAAGARTFAEVRAFCAAEEARLPDGGGHGHGCCTAEMAALLRGQRGGGRDGQDALD